MWVRKSEKDSCLFDDDELARFKRFLDDPALGKEVRKSNISSTLVRCSPVIDVLQDLTAVRCFGLSKSTKRPISAYKNFTDLRNYYLRTVDSYGFNSVYSKQCINCYDRETLRCMGGCLAFKEHAIEELSKCVDEKLNALG